MVIRVVVLSCMHIRLIIRVVCAPTTVVPTGMIIYGVLYLGSDYYVVLSAPGLMNMHWSDEHALV